jgi:hypothetical protein
MSVQAVLLPVFVLVALTFAIHIRMGYLRVTSVKRGETKMRDIALGQPGWPDDATQWTRAFQNQFELPVLFYVLVALALPLRQADLIFVILSWVFVVLRLIHAYIHTGTNDVPNRFYVYLAGAIVLMIMWILFALKILLAI